MTQPWSREVLATGTSLTDGDFAALESRWIDRALAQFAGIRRIDSMTGAECLARRDNGGYAGLLIPYFRPGESRIREWRLRRDRPDIEYKNGQPKEVSKYLSPTGCRNMIYFVPGISAEFLADVATPIIVTEGEFKTLALWRLAKFDSVAPRFVPVGFSGVWNWRGTIGKTPGPDGERVDVKGAIPDLDLITWTNRRVIIAFDSDTEKNSSVQAAKQQLSRELSIRGAAVGFVIWDGADGKGIDDLLARVGPSKVLNLLENVEFDRDQDNDRITVYELATAITSRHWFAQDAASVLYVYKDGHYKVEGAKFIRSEVKRLLQRMRLASKWTSHKSEEVVRYIAVDAPTLWEKLPSDRINVLNGLLNVETHTLEPHSPQFLSAIQLPVRFDPMARCPAWDQFVLDVFPADSEAIAWEIPAWLMTPDTSIQKAILLIGEGSNGKSTYLRGVQAFLGLANFSAITIQRLEYDRFAVARLVGKLANICSDLPSSDLTNTSIFKAITGGDTLSAERKFEESFEFTPYARLVFSANNPPKSPDASTAFFRRWIVVPFQRTFQSGAADTLPPDQLDAALADPIELSGVLNKALEALASLRRRGFTESASMDRAAEEFRQTTDPFAVWLDRHTIIAPTGLVVIDELSRKYYDDCILRGRPTLSKTAIGRAMSQLRPSVERLQRTVEGHDGTPWCYVGITWRHNR